MSRKNVEKRNTGENAALEAGRCAIVIGFPLSGRTVPVFDVLSLPVSQTSYFVSTSKGCLLFMYA